MHIHLYVWCITCLSSQLFLFFILNFYLQNLKVGISFAWRIFVCWTPIWTEFFFFLTKTTEVVGFSGGSVGKESSCDAGDLGSVPGLGRCPGEGDGDSLQCSCLEAIVDRGAWGLAGCSPWGCKESDTTEQLTHTHWSSDYAEYVY